jgi:hypothetical protein
MSKLQKNIYGHAGLWVFMGLFLFSACSTMPAKDIAVTSAKIAVEGDGLPGSPMIITGSGFKSAEVIDLELDMGGLAMQLGNASGKPLVAAENGTFKVESGYPAKQIFAPGTWDLSASGDKGSAAKCKVLMKLK